MAYFQISTKSLKRAMLKKIVFVLVILLLLSSCSKNTKIPLDQSTIDKLNLDDTSVHLYAITIDQLTNSSDSKGLNGYVLLLRPDCKGCQTFVTEFNEYSSSNKINSDIYVLDTTILTEEEKETLFTVYSVTSVSSIMVFESGNFISLEVGISSKGQLSSILK